LNSFIEVKHLSKTFNTEHGDVNALKDISFKVNKGDIFGIIGLSGAGKSTLIRCLNRLEKPTSGQVIVGNDDLASLSEKDLRLKRRKIGMIFQSFNLLMQRNILDNVCFPMEIEGISLKERKQRALEYLEIVGLKDKAKAYPAELSGGQKQRVAIARVLASNPEILLCDEATSALDPETTKSILKLIKDINEKYNITCILITHEMSVIQEICNYCVVLENGELVEEGSVEELFKKPKTNAAKRLIFNATNQYIDTTNGKILRIAFEDSNTNEPVVANLILEFKTPINILESNISDINGKSRGQMLIQLPNDDKLSSKMITYLKRKKHIVISEVN